MVTAATIEPWACEGQCRLERQSDADLPCSAPAAAMVGMVHPGKPVVHGFLEYLET